MIKVTTRIEEALEAGDSLTLPFNMRQKSRFRARLDSGKEVGVALPRGSVLREGDRLRGEDGTVISVHAAPEPVSTAFSRDPMAVARACYHLGNRHVPLQIGDTWVRYVHDHVLDGMVSALGLKVFFEHASFEPENGAYHGHGAANTHSTEHAPRDREGHREHHAH